MRKFLLTLVFCFMMYVYWYAHRHLVWSLSWWPADRKFGVVFSQHMIAIRGIHSLDQFNAWLGAHFAEDRPVTYTAWIGFLVLSAVPNKVLGVILFVVPFWVKVFVICALHWLFMISLPGRRRRRQLQKTSISRLADGKVDGDGSRDTPLRRQARRHLEQRRS
ncbi:hypothetical protein ACOALA_14930 [Alicyclobacillus acidoterrestris]|uniref:hypothetical protein n=1 Tax=Alicyclobacillus acidoterrestris TaxID=1450 RepID=UPI003F533801